MVPKVSEFFFFNKLYKGVYDKIKNQRWKRIALKNTLFHSNVFGMKLVRIIDKRKSLYNILTIQLTSSAM